MSVQRDEAQSAMSEVVYNDQSILLDNKGMRRNATNAQSTSFLPVLKGVPKDESRLHIKSGLLRKDISHPLLHKSTLNSSRIQSAEGSPANAKTNESYVGTME